MGFGILFFGYFLCLPAFANLFYTMPFGGILLAVACFKLARVNRPFGNAFYVSLALIPVSLTSCILRLIPATGSVAVIFEVITLLVWLVWHILVMTGLEWVSEETGLQKLRVKAFRNKLFTSVYLLFVILLTGLENVPLATSIGRFLSIFAVALIVVGLVIMILNLLGFYSAYVRICMPEDVDMPRKPSRFDFVNRRREEEDRREAENAAALETARARKREELEQKFSTGDKKKTSRTAKKRKK